MENQLSVYRGNADRIARELAKAKIPATVTGGSGTAVHFSVSPDHMAKASEIAQLVTAGVPVKPFPIVTVLLVAVGVLGLAVNVVPALAGLGIVGGVGGIAIIIGATGFYLFHIVREQFWMHRFAKPSRQLPKQSWESTGSFHARQSNGKWMQALPLAGGCLMTVLGVGLLSLAGWVYFMQ